MRYGTIFKFIVCLISISFFQQAIANNEDIFDLTLEENLKTPQIKKNNIVEKIQEFQLSQAEDLSKSTFDVDLTRNNEVIVATITADQLFAANDTLLSGPGKELLSPIIKLSRNTGFYKIVLVMHSDNTRTEPSSLDLTKARVNSVFDFFEAIGTVDYVVPYALGSKQPSQLTGNNNSMENRRLNRRLEIYLIPYDGMIEQAKHGSININIPVKNNLTHI